MGVLPCGLEEVALNRAVSTVGADGIWQNSTSNSEIKKGGVFLFHKGVLLTRGGVLLSLPLV
jgi:hypothetical protein